MEFVSCSPSSYSGPDFYENQELLSLLADPLSTPAEEISVLTDLYPPFRYSRPKVSIIQGCEAFWPLFLESNANLNRAFTAGPGSVLARVDNVYVYYNVLYSSSGSGFRTLYETYRPCDRLNTPMIDWTTATANHIAGGDPDETNFFLPSVGTFNYGHWLVDDLPRAAAIGPLLQMQPSRPLSVWITSAGEKLDSVRRESLTALYGHFGEFKVRIASPESIMHFRSLYYPSPITYHPVLKSPEAMESIARPFCGTRPLSEGTRIYVTRSQARGRNLLNEPDIMFRLAQEGFTIVDVETMSFTEQAQTFADASIIVGCMGAAMTNCVFARSRTVTAYLVPEGWVEPFYWDLAAVRGHQYAVCFGAVADPTVPPHMSSYTVEMAAFDRMLDQILSSSAQ